MKRLSLPAALVLASCLTVAYTVVPHGIAPVPAGDCECPVEPSTSSSGTSGDSSSGDLTTGTSGGVVACEPCPATLTRCAALDLACEPLGISDEDCKGLHGVCTSGLPEAEVCAAAVKVSTQGDPGMACACAFLCPA